MAELTLPLAEKTVRDLEVGAGVELTGRMITGRDAAHKWLLEDYREEVAPFMEGSVIYHCGPVVRQADDGTYEFVAAGPTTSIREEPYQAEVIEKYGLRGVIGKGGMGLQTLAGLEKSGALYLHAVGGAAQVLAQAVKKVERVFMLEEFGVPQALWVIDVEKFPVMVTMDTRRGSLHTEVEDFSKQQFERLLAAGA